MNYKEIIKELRGYSYWLGQSGPESHEIHPKICGEAATAIEKLLSEREGVHAHAVVNWLGDCHCSNCGKSIDCTSNYCNWCGAKLDEPEQRIG